MAHNNDLQGWKDSESYGKRWIVETMFSCIKRRFLVNISLFYQISKHNTRNDVKIITD
jgi:hypothetical protein